MPIRDFRDYPFHIMFLITIIVFYVIVMTSEKKFISWSHSLTDCDYLCLFTLGSKAHQYITIMTKIHKYTILRLPRV